MTHYAQWWWSVLGLKWWDSAVGLEVEGPGLNRNSSICVVYSDLLCTVEDLIVKNVNRIIKSLVRQNLVASLQHPCCPIIPHLLLLLALVWFHFFLRIQTVSDL